MASEPPAQGMVAAAGQGEAGAGAGAGGGVGCAAPGPEAGQRQRVQRQRCQRIGCDAFFTEEENGDSSCTFHPGMPIFHDGTKEWSCCKARSYDFSLFLQLPGCVRGRHTTEKPNISSQSTSKSSAAAPAATGTGAAAIGTSGALGHPPTGSPGLQEKRGAPGVEAVSRSRCQRCSQGLYCTAQHVEQPAASQATSAPARGTPTAPAAARAGQRRMEGDSGSGSGSGSGGAGGIPKWDLNAERTCRHQGCGVRYREKDNHDSACFYHPGPASFHDRKRRWLCCNAGANEFDDFLSLPPCAKGWHDDHNTSS